MPTLSGKKTKDEIAEELDQALARIERLEQQVGLLRQLEVLAEKSQSLTDKQLERLIIKSNLETFKQEQMKIIQDYLFEAVQQLAEQAGCVFKDGILQPKTSE